jgi:hypothetical protein
MPQFPIPPLHFKKLSNSPLVEAVLNNLRWIAAHYCVRRHVFCNNRPCRNDRAITDCYPFKDSRIVAYPNIVIDNNIAFRINYIQRRQICAW